MIPGLPARRHRAQSAAAAGAPEAPSGRPRPGSQGAPGGSSGHSARSGPVPVTTSPGPRRPRSVPPPSGRAQARGGRTRSLGPTGNAAPLGLPTS